MAGRGQGLNPALGLLVAAAAAFVGLYLPDVDRLFWLGHRSGLTHSVLPALAVLELARRHGWAVSAAAGLALGTAIHCAADLFPRTMQGYATIKLPFAGGIGAGASYAWLLATVAIGLLLPLWLVERRFGPRALAAAIVAAGVMAAAYILLHDEPWLTAGAVGGTLAAAHPATRRRLRARLDSALNRSPPA